MNNSKFERIWPLISDIFEHKASCKGGRPMLHCVKDILAGVYWILDTGAKWRTVPKDYPPRSPCHYWF